MKRSFAALMIAVVGSLSLASVSDAQRFSPSNLVPAEMAERYGLRRAWYTQIQVDPNRGRMVGMTTHVSSTQAMSAFEVVYDGHKEFITERDLNAFREPIGIEEAQKAADRRASELTAAGHSVEIVPIVTPEITLFVTTDMGLLQAIDAESGRTKWVTGVPFPDRAIFAPAATDSLVAVVNSIHVLLYNSADGKLIWQQRLTGIPGAGPAIAGDYVFVPTMNGVVEGFKIDDVKAARLIHKSHGRAVVQPIVGADSLIWTTGQYDINVGGVSSERIRYRLEAAETIVPQVSFLPPDKFLVAARSGNVFCFSERAGGMLWRYATGHEMVAEPLALGSSVYAATIAGVFSLNASTGELQWQADRIRSILSGSGDRLYCLNDVGQLVILNTETGGRLATVPTRLGNVPFVNTHTDRLYLGNSTGLIQCLHEPQHDWPMIHAGSFEIAQGDPDKPPADKPPAQQGPVDPFGGAPKTDTKPANNPFKVDTNPFK